MPSAPLREADGGRFGLAALGESRDGAEVVDDGPGAAGGDPAAGLVVDGVPGGQVVGGRPPGGPGADQPSQGVEDLAEALVALRGVLGDRRQVGRDEGPLGVADVGVARLALCRQTIND